MRRLEQVAAVLKKELAPLITNSLENESGIVTLTDVEVQPDLKEAKVYVSCFEKENEKEVFKILENHAKEYQYVIGRRLRMKFTPKLNFICDTSTDNVTRIEQLLHEVNKSAKGGSAYGGKGK